MTPLLTGLSCVSLLSEDALALSFLGRSVWI